jgi:uncharacterized membrane protein YqjE
MDESTASLGHLGTITKQLVRRLLTIGENRLELLAVEAQEERQRLLCAFLLALVACTFGLLAGITLTAAIVLWLRMCSPVVVLLLLTGLYALVGFGVYLRLTSFMREWQPFSGTLDQLRKDRAALEKHLT